VAKTFNFAAKIKALSNAKSRIPDLLAGISLRHFQRSFKNQGFTDQSFNPWVERKTRNRSDRNNPKKRRAILVDSGTLRKSGKIKIATWKRVVVGFYGTNYGTFHNRGLGNNPKRQFIGNSKELTRLIEKEINNHLSNILRS